MPGDGIQPEPDPGAGPLSSASSSLACSAGLSLGLRLLLSQLILYSFGLSLNLCASGHFQRGWAHLFSSCLAFMLSYMQSVLCVCALLALTDLCNYGTHSIMHGPGVRTTQRGPAPGRGAHRHVACHTE